MLDCRTVPSEAVEFLKRKGFKPLSDDLPLDADLAWEATYGHNKLFGIDVMVFVLIYERRIDVYQYTDSEWEWHSDFQSWDAFLLYFGGR